MKVLLYQPQIPQNTGNIVRTCSVTGAGLILVKPYGFSISNRMLKRAGLDYWDDLEVLEVFSLEEYLKQTLSPFYFFSSKAKQNFTDISYAKESILIFGSETSGLPTMFWDNWPEKFVTIPMKQQSRCLNLSNAVAIATYEVLRQNHFNFSYEKSAS